MKNSILIILLSTILYSCGEDPEPVVLKELVKELETKTLENQPEIETITDFDKINELKLQIINEKLAAERLRLDSLSLAERLIAHDTLVYDTVNNLLTSGNINEIKIFLSEFLRFKPIKYQLQNSTIEQNILNLINETSIESKAIRTIGILNLNFEAAFVERFHNGQEEQKGKYFYWIARKGKNEKILDEVTDLIKSKKIIKSQQKDIINGLRQFSNSRSKKIKEKAISAALLTYKSKWVIPQDISTLKQKKDRNAMAESFVKMMLDNGGEKAKSVSGICLKQGIFIRKVFKNMVRSKNNKTKSILLEQLINKERFLKTLPVIPMVYAMEKDTLIPVKTIQMMEKHKIINPDVVKKIHYIFEKMNCLDYLKNCGKYIKNEDLIKQLQRQALLPKPAPETYDEIVLDLFELEVTDSIDLITLKQIKNNEVYQGKNALIKNILHYNNQIVTIDKWSSTAPIDYAFLIYGITNQLKGSLTNLAIKSEFKNNEYSILMIGESKALFAYPKNKEDEINVELLVKAFNEIISDRSLHILANDPDFIELFYGTKTEFNNVKSLIQNQEQGLAL